MKEKLAWIFDNIQKLEGVPLTEHNVDIIKFSLHYLREVYAELEEKEREQTCS
jgi:hypothetical protein